MSSTTEKPVEVSILDTAVAVVRLNRPSKRNCLSQHMIDELTGSLRRLDQDVAVRAIVLTSVDGSPFCGRYAAAPWGSQKLRTDM
jgi:enoyl-CoA hydratase